MTDNATSRLSSTETEESLIGRVRLRDQEALAEIYDRFASIVYSISLRVLREESAAEAATQEAFLYVWRNPDGYTPPTRPLWVTLALIGRNLAIDRLRGRSAEDSIENRALGSCVDRGDFAEQNFTMQEIRRTIGSLPAIQRQILDCACFGGLTLVEIAAYTGEPITSVKVHLRCALLALEG
jgi:RNA polymerase sigma-70 factor (ECF subfamily)